MHGWYIKPGPVGIGEVIAALSLVVLLVFSFVNFVIAAANVLITGRLTVWTRKTAELQSDSELQVTLLGAPTAVKASATKYEIRTSDGGLTTVQVEDIGPSAAREVEVKMVLKSDGAQSPQVHKLGALDARQLQAIAFQNVMYLGAAKAGFGFAPSALKLPLRKKLAMTVARVPAHDKILITVPIEIIRKWVLDNLVAGQACACTLEVDIKWRDSLRRKGHKHASFYMDIVGRSPAAAALCWRLKTGDSVQAAA